MCGGILFLKFLEIVENTMYTINYKFSLLRFCYVILNLVSVIFDRGFCGGDGE